MLDQSKSAIRAAVLSGKRGLRIDVLIPQFNISSRGFDRASLFDLSAGVAMQLGFVGDGPRLLVFQAPTAWLGSAGAPVVPSGRGTDAWLAPRGRGRQAPAGGEGARLLAAGW